jgi:hypothetical protein
MMYEVSGNGAATATTATSPPRTPVRGKECVRRKGVESPVDRSNKVAQPCFEAVQEPPEHTSEAMSRSGSI